MQTVCRRRVEFIRINCETMPNRPACAEAPLAKILQVEPTFGARPGTGTLHL